MASRPAGDTPRLVRVGPLSPGLGRQHRGDRFPGASGVVLSRPLGKPDDLRWNERLVVQRAADRFDFAVRGIPPLRIDAISAIDDDARDAPGADGHNHPRTDGRRLDVIGHGVSEEVERGDRNGDVDEHRKSKIKN